jgi:hypothetical protein
MRIANEFDFSDNQTKTKNDFATSLLELEWGNHKVQPLNTFAP